MMEKLMRLEAGDLVRRRQLVMTLFAGLKERKSGDDRLDMVEIAHELLTTDPMTIQEAGVVARALRDLLREEWPGLSDGEWLELYGGDYKTAEMIFGRNDLRKSVWDKSVLARNDSEEEIYLFRELDIDRVRAGKIKHAGLVSQGSNQFGGIREVIPMLVRPGIGRVGLTELPITKFNLFREVWQMEPDTGSSPFKLGLSFATLENLSNLNRVIFGRWMVVARIKANMVVAEDDKNYKNEDERTLLFELPPENVVAILDNKGKDRKQILAAVNGVVGRDGLKRKMLRRTGL